MTEYDANYWKTRHVLLEGKHRKLQEQHDELRGQFCKVLDALSKTLADCAAAIAKPKGSKAA
jgi:hypothetical protein